MIEIMNTKVLLFCEKKIFYSSLTWNSREK